MLVGIDWKCTACLLCMPVECIPGGGLVSIQGELVVFCLAVGDRGRSKKWKEMLRLPLVAQCLCLRDEIGERCEGEAEQDEC